MVKTLCDICLSVVQVSLNNVPNFGDYIPTVYKELLIERLGCHDLLTPDYLPYVSSTLFTKLLRRINFYKCEQVNDNVLNLIECSGCKLEDLTIHQCNSITDKGFQSITRKQDKLQTLRFKKLKGLTDVGLQEVNSSCLLKVDLKNCTYVSFEGACSLVEHNPSIKQLQLSGIDEIIGERANSNKTLERSLQKHEQLIKIAKYLGNTLEELETQLNQINDDCLIALAQNCPNLKTLSIHGSSRVTGQALTKLFMGCTNLQSLDLSYCNDLCQAPGCESLWTLPTSLTELSLCGILLADERIFVECFQRFKNLKSTRLCGVVALNDKTLREILQHIGHSLTSLDLSGSISGKLTDNGLSAIPENCNNLEVLALSLLSGLTGLKLMPLFKDPQRALKFRKLYLSVKGLDPSVVQAVVESCHNIEMLDLSGLNFVDDDLLMTLVKNCSSLSELNLKGCRMVTDKGVCEIARCLSLRILVLAGINYLTDMSIFALANTCHYLEEIYLNGCAQISPTAVRYLVDCTIPRLFVKHATPNARPNQLMARNLDTGEFCRADLISYNFVKP